MIIFFISYIFLFFHKLYHIILVKYKIFLTTKVTLGMCFFFINKKYIDDGTWDTITHILIQVNQHTHHLSANIG